MSDFYVRYNKETQVPDAISGSPIEAGSEGFAVGRVTQADAEDFLLMRKQLHRYLVTPKKKYVFFRPKDAHTALARPTDPAVVQDLNYNEHLFGQFGIRSFQDGTELTLKFEFSSLSDDAKLTFTSLAKANGAVVLYITKFLTPFEVLDVVELSLPLLKTKKKITIQLPTTLRVSVYLSKTEKKNV